MDGEFIIMDQSSDSHALNPALLRGQLLHAAIQRSLSNEHLDIFDSSVIDNRLFQSIVYCLFLGVDNGDGVHDGTFFASSEHSDVSANPSSITNHSFSSHG